MSNSQSYAIPPDSLQTTRNENRSPHESAAEAPCDVMSTTGITKSDEASAGSGKRKLADGEFSNGEEKRVRKDSPASSSSDTNEVSPEEADEEKIGQPRVAYPITAPLGKTKPPSVRGPVTLDVLQGLSVPGVMPGVVPGIVPGVVPGVVSGMIPAMPLPLGGPGVGSVPMLSFGGAMSSPLNMAAMVNLQALQMSQLLKAFIPSTNNLGKLLTNEQMALLATQMNMASCVSSQTPLHPRAPLGVSSAPSSANTTISGNASNRPLQDNNTSSPSGAWVLDSVRQTLESQRRVGVTAANRDGSHSNQTIDHPNPSEATSGENSSESDDARFRVSDAESATGFSGGREALPPNGGHLLPQQLQDLSYVERRRKNNDSARRSRDARRTRIDETARRVAFLEMENLQMRAIIEAEREYLARMHQDLMQRKGAWNPAQFAAMKQVLDNISSTNAARLYSSGQQVVTTPATSASIKQEQPAGSEAHLNCDVRPS